MINFHGSQKPTGEVRTWPHQVTQEGIREQEYLLWGDLPLPHYSALPFTRMAVGHADFLPGYVRKKYLKNTSATFQMALQRRAGLDRVGPRRADREPRALAGPSA